MASSLSGRSRRQSLSGNLGPVTFKFWSLSVCQRNFGPSRSGNSFTKYIGYRIILERVLAMILDPAVVATILDPIFQSRNIPGGVANLFPGKPFFTWQIHLALFYLLTGIFIRTGFGRKLVSLSHGCFP